VDKVVDDKSKSLLNVDTSVSPGEYCLAGAATGVDATVTLNRKVTFSYTARGDLTKETDKQVRAGAKSVPVVLGLLIVDTLSPNDGGPNYFYSNELLEPVLITEDCKLAIRLVQPGGLPSTPPAGEVALCHKDQRIVYVVQGSTQEQDHLNHGDNLGACRARDRVSLDCDLGENFSKFPGLADQPDLLANIRYAFDRRKFVKTNLKRGRLKIKTSGTQVLPEDDPGEAIFKPLHDACAAPPTTTPPPPE
jgi:hypothetical protein